MEYIKNQDVTFSVKKAITINVDGEDKTVFPFVLTSERIDRDGEVVLQSGLNIDNYKENNLVFFNHEIYKHAVGNAYNVRKQGKKIVGDVWFHELDEDSQQIKRYVEAGVYKAGSIGFRVFENPRKRPATPQEKEAYNFPYITELTKTELFEFSIVKFPANPDSQMVKEYKKLYELELQAKEKGKLNEKDNLMEQLYEKAGATLNKTNKKKLNDAKSLIDDVLASASNEEPEKDSLIQELRTQLEEANKTIEKLKSVEKIKYEDWKKEQLINN